MKIVSLLLTALILASCGTYEPVVLDEPKPLPTPTPVPPFTGEVFKSGDGVFYRIPTLQRLNDGRIIVFAEERKASFSDASTTKIAYRVIDGDKLSFIRYISSFPVENIWSNPQPIPLKNGNILLLVDIRDKGTASLELCNRTAHQSIHVLTATQADLAFSETTAQWNSPYIDNTWLQKISPTHGYETEDGTIYAATFALGPEDCAHRTHAMDQSSIMISNDGGKSFNGYIGSEYGTNEMSFDFYQPGLPIMAMRYYNGSTPDRARAIQIGGGLFSEVHRATTLVHGGVTVVNGVPYLSMPNNSTRSDLAITNAITNDYVTSVKSGPAGYSNMLNVDGKIAIVYESGETEPLAYESIQLKYVGVP